MQRAIAELWGTEIPQQQIFGPLSRCSADARRPRDRPDEAVMGGWLASAASASVCHICFVKKRLLRLTSLKPPLGNYHARLQPDRHLNASLSRFCR